MSQPKLKTSDLVSQLNGLPAGFDFDSFMARRILRDIHSLRDVAPAESFMLEGMMNALAWRSSEAISCFEKAKLISCSDSLLENYALSLSLLSKHDKALDIYRGLILSGSVDTRSDLAFGLWCAAAAVDVDSYRELEEIYNQFIKENPGSLEADARESYSETPSYAVKVFQMDAVTKFMNNVLSFVDSYQLDKHKLKEIVSLAGDVANNNKVTFSAVDSAIDNFYGEEVLHVRILVDELADRIHELNEQFLDKLLDNDDLSNLSGVVTSFNYGTV